MRLGILSMSPGKRWLILCFRVIIGGLFLYAGLSKIAQPYKFAAAIQAYQLLPEFIVGLAAALIPWIEVVCALALLFGWKPRSALIMFMILMISFILVIGLTMFRGLEIDCGCGLWGGRQVGWLLLTEDFILLSVISWLYYQLLAGVHTLAQQPQGY